MAMSRSAGVSQVTSRSAMRIRPSVTGSRPAMAFIRVDLPHPEGPTRIRNSPDSMARLTSLRTRSLPKSLRTS